MELQGLQKRISLLQENIAVQKEKLQQLSDAEKSAQMAYQATDALYQRGAKDYLSLRLLIRSLRFSLKVILQYPQLIAGLYRLSHYRLAPNSLRRLTSPARLLRLKYHPLQ